jgi:hypothetical protein
MFLTACASSPIPIREPVRCDEPELKGDTWADVGILAIEQREALRTCNVRNGFVPKPEIAQATEPAISPLACRLTGVAVKETAKPTGTISDEFEHSPGFAAPVCGVGTIGCAIQVGLGVYEIHYEPSDMDWVRKHEICHAIYQVRYHTASYNRARNLVPTRP